LTFVDAVSLALYRRLSIPGGHHHGSSIDEGGSDRAVLRARGLVRVRHGLGRGDRPGVRLHLYSLVAGAGPDGVCVCDLVGPSGRSQPTVSHHLRILREAGLVASERRGTWVWYSAQPAQRASLRAALD
jgi:DNA-binding transcriptional ArsR family regulator